MAAIIVCEESCWLKLYFVGGDILCRLVTTVVSVSE